MIIHNFLKAEQTLERIHNGEGLCNHSNVFKEDDFQAPIRFLNYTIVPPGGSLGLHKHGDDNELYILLEGKGVYTEDGTEQEVETGDVMLNAPYAEHAIRNTGTEPMRMLVLESYNR